MIKKLSIALAVSVFFSAGSSIFANSCYKTIDDKTGKAKSYVLISGSSGYIKKLTNPADKGKKCTACKGSLKNKPIEGLRIISGMKMGKKAGTIIDPKNGKSYTLKVWKSGSNLKVRGYVGFFYRTQTWKSAPMSKCQ